MKAEFLSRAFDKLSILLVADAASHFFTVLEAENCGVAGMIVWGAQGNKSELRQ